MVVWSEHADLISKAYAGTGALKTDFTRTGKRTRGGAIDDFKKSAMRYLKNNFFDGARQVRKPPRPHFSSSSAHETVARTGRL